MWSSLGPLEREPGRECEMVPERDMGPEREPGREKLRCSGLVGGGLDDGGNIVVKLGCSEGLGGEPGLETFGWGSGLAGGLNDGLDWKNGPSSAFAGDGDRLPGMGGNPEPFIIGLDWSTVSRMCEDTPEVSQESKPSSLEGPPNAPSKEDRCD